MTALAEPTVPRGTDFAADPRIHSLPLDFIAVGPNVRVALAGLDELAASIAEQGVLQPITVRHGPDNAGYVVLIGQRRTLAARQAGLIEIPALIDDTERTAAELAIAQLVENLQREDMAPLDRARAMRAVVDAGVTQADLARQLGIGASTVANDLGLLEAPAPIRKAIEDGKLTPAHAKALKGLDKTLQEQLAKRAVEDGWSAHQTEREATRQREWQQRQHDNEADRERAASAADHVLYERIQKLALEVPPSTPIRVATNYNAKKQVETAVAMFVAAGFDATADRFTDRPKGGFCTCTAFGAELTWQGHWVVKPTCIVPGHSEAKYQAERKADAEEREFHERVAQHLQGLITTEFLELIRRSPIVARALLWNLFDWSLNDWVRDHKGDRKKPNAWDEISSLPPGELAVEMARFFAKGFGDRYNVKLDWPRIASELGLDEKGRPAK